LTTIAYVSNADSGSLSVLALDEQRGTLATLQTLEPGGQLMPLALGPDRRRLYVARRSEPLAVLAYAIDAASGRLSALGEAALPHSMAHLAVDASGRWLFSASYGGNLVAVSPLDTRGVPQPAQQVLPTGPHAHAMRATPDNRYVFATTLGGGELLQFRFDAATGLLTPNEPAAVTVRAGAGPRHLAFDPNAPRLYLLNELDASLEVYALDTGRGTLALTQTVATLPSGFAGVPWAADLRVTPDGRFLYTSERRSSTLAGFAIDAVSGTLTPIGHWPTQTQPRGFAITPSGRFLLAAGQLSHAVGLHAIDAATGALREVQVHPVGQNPNWVEIVTLP